jgi:hypothetical protein
MLDVAVLLGMAVTTGATYVTLRNIIENIKRNDRYGK